MGFFGTYLFGVGRWRAHQPAEQPAVPEPWLLVDIPDSDIATLTNRRVRVLRGVTQFGSVSVGLLEVKRSRADQLVSVYSGGSVSQHPGGPGSTCCTTSSDPEIIETSGP